MLVRLWRKENPNALLVGMQTGAATVADSMGFPQKIKKKTTFSPSIPLLGIYHTNSETPIQKKICTFMFRAALFTIPSIWKKLKCPSVVEWVKKLSYFYIMVYYIAGGEKRRNSYLLRKHGWNWGLSYKVK